MNSKNLSDVESELLHKLQEMITRSERLEETLASLRRATENFDREVKKGTA